MEIGDLAFFYHSSCPVPGIVGVMRVVSEAYPDPTQFQSDSEYFDGKSQRDNPRWITRDVEYVEKFKTIVSLSQLRNEPGLEGMAVLQRGQRLSVQRVTPKEWEIVMSLVRH